MGGGTDDHASDDHASDDHGGGGGHGGGHVSIYGSILNVGSVRTSIVLICLFTFLTMLEYLLRAVQKFSERYKFDPLFGKLKQELMILGIISFASFIVESSISELDYALLASFEVGHIIVLFIAFAFMLQAIFLMQYAHYMSMTYLKAVRTNSSDIEEDYNKMISDNDLNQVDLNMLTFTEKILKKYININPKWLFDHIPYWFPSLSQLRDKIEFKIIEKHFLSQHPVPNEFDFAKYVSLLFRHYIAELGEVSPVSWMVLALLVVMNLAKIKIFDKDEIHKMCVREHQSDSNNACREEYLLQYSYACSVLLGVAILIVYIATMYYYEKLISISLKKGFDLTYVRKLRSSIYLDALKVLVKEEKLHYLSRNSQQMQSFATANKINPYLPNKTVKSNKAKSRKSVVEEFYKKTLEKSEAEKSLKYMEGTTVSGIEKIKGMVKLRVWKASTQEELNCDLYLFNQPRIYFKAIEILLLLQSFYLSIYFTQLLPITSKSSYSGGWAFGLTIPIIINFIIFREILTKAIILNACWRLERRIVGKVCEDTIEEELILDKVRASIYSLVDDAGSAHADPYKLFKFLQSSFNLVQVDKGYVGYINRDEFMQFLQIIHVYLTEEKFELLWNVVDYDLCGVVSFDEIFVLSFPHLKQFLKKNLTIAAKLRRKFQFVLTSKKIPKDKWENELRSMFKAFDKDNSGYIDEKEFQHMIFKLGFRSDEMDSKSFKLLLQSINLNDKGLISIDEFKDLILNYDNEVIMEGETSAVSPLHELKSKGKSPSIRDIFDLPTSISRMSSSALGGSSTGKGGAVTMVPMMATASKDIESDLYTVYK